MLACLLRSLNVPSLSLLHFRRFSPVDCRFFCDILRDGRRGSFRSRPGFLGWLLAGRCLDPARDSKQVFIPYTGNLIACLTGFERLY